MTEGNQDAEQKPASVQPQAPMVYTPEEVDRLRKISEAGRRAVKRMQRELEQAKQNEQHDRER